MLYDFVIYLFLFPLGRGGRQKVKKMWSYLWSYFKGKFQELYLEKILKASSEEFVIAYSKILVETLGGKPWVIFRIRQIWELKLLE